MYMYPKSRTKFLIVDTERPSLRAEIQGWDYEDISLINPEKPVGLSASWEGPVPTFGCVSFALAAGWELMGPPTPVKTPTDNGPKIYWTWWLRLDDCGSGDL